MDLATYLSIPLIQNMFVTTVFACILCSVVGTYVVVNRMVSMTGGIAHTTFGGVGFAYFAMSVLAVGWLTPFYGALLFGVAAAVILTICKKVPGLRIDTVIGVMWAIGMAAGVIFMGATDRSVVTPASYETILFGNVLFVSTQNMLIVVAATVAVVAVIAYLYRDLQVLIFDDTHARLSGMRTLFYDLALYLLIAIVCVVASKVVGIIMVIALMTIPVAMAELSAKNLKEIMFMASASSSILAFLGLVLCLVLDTPPGATVVLIIGAAYVILLVATSLRRRFAKHPVEESGRT